jgi:hypothetical protein
MPNKLLKISNHVFDAEGNLIIYTPQQWNSSLDHAWKNIKR